MAEACKFPDGLSGELQDMLAASVQRFYLPPGSIAKAGELQFSANGSCGGYGET